MKMSRFDKAERYIDKLYCDIKETNLVVSTGIIELDALFFIKYEIAKKDSIEMSFQISSQLHNIKIPTFDLVKIVGNLLNNAMYAASKSRGERCVHIQLCQDSKGYIFSIFNTGPAIAPGIKEKIFKHGFSTKGDRGEGLGLYITKNLLKKYHAQITFESSETKGTKFIVQIPCDQLEATDVPGVKKHSACIHLSSRQ